MNLVDVVEKDHINELSELILTDKKEDNLKMTFSEYQELFKDRTDIFNIGDLVKVHVRIVEGKRERIQVFEGYVIAIKGHGITKTFTVRKLSFGVGVERTFPIFSPKIEKIDRVRRGRIRRSKLYYLRDRKGKSANVKEKINYKK